jgi:hypothetical protein
METEVKTAEVVVSFITPLLVVFLGWQVRQLERKLKVKEYAEQKVMDWRLSVYQEVAPALNDIFCYTTHRGGWKEFKPPQIIGLKRALDKKISIYSPYLSVDWRSAYEAFMDTCFVTYTGKGNDAQLRCGMNSHKEFGNYNWDEEWDKLFVQDQSFKSDKQEIAKRYNSLLAGFANELGLRTPEEATSVLDN